MCEDCALVYESVRDEFFMDFWAAKWHTVAMAKHSAKKKKGGKASLAIFLLLIIAAGIFVLSGRLWGGKSPAGAAELKMNHYSIDLIPDKHDSFGVQAVLESLTLKQKVCQLFFIRPEDIQGGQQKSVTPAMLDAVNDYPPGGFVIFSDNITNEKQLKNFTYALKRAFRVPAILSVDEEGGNVARLANNKALGISNVGTMGRIGASKDTEKAEAAGYTIGSYLKDYGFSLDFAPDADVFSNPKNTVIGTRAFGSDPQLVSRMVSACIDGFHEAGVGTTIKHFPGHGDTAADTHSGYVAVNKSWEELLDMELVPFMDNMDKTDMIMVAHITMKNVTSDGLPASLSKELIEGRLRGELGYDGIVITDALGMGAISRNYKPGEAAVLAFEAGNDILLLPGDYKKAADALLEAVESGRISEERVDESVRRILEFKYRYCR